DHDTALAGMGAAAWCAVGLAPARPSRAAASLRAIQGGVMAGYRRAVRRRALEPSAVGIAVDAADTATRLAAHRSAASPHGQNAWLAADKSLLPDQMSPAVSPRAAGVCNRLFGQHGAIHANTLARRGAFQHPYHRNRGAQQRRQHPDSG